MEMLYHGVRAARRVSIKVLPLKQVKLQSETIKLYQHKVIPFHWKGIDLLLLAELSFLIAKFASDNKIYFPLTEYPFLLN